MSDEGMEIEVARPVTAIEIKAQVQAIQQVMKAVMKDGVHYGKIPGCGDKPSLLKPGAEKIMATFRLAADPIVEDLSTLDEIRYRVKVCMTAPDGTFVGAGIGECSTNEEKYKWKKATCKEEFDETPEDRRRNKWKAGWNGAAATTTMQIRTNPADLANTVLKMAKKRGLVDGTLTATGASDVFAQDLEDTPMREGNNGGTPPPSKASTVQQKPAAEKPPMDTGGKNVLNALADELGEFCGGDTEAMSELLKELSLFTVDGKEVYAKSIKTMSEKWAGKTLSKLRARIKEESEGKEPGDKYPADCTKDPKTCEHSKWQENRAFCDGKLCEFGPF